MKPLKAVILVSILVLATAWSITRLGSPTVASVDSSPVEINEQSGLAAYSQPAPSDDFLAPQANGEPDDADDDMSKSPFVGIAVQTLDEGNANELGIAGGAIIRRVLDDGPTGDLLAVGDIITAIDDSAVLTAQDVIDAVERAAPDDVLSFTVAGKDADVMITVGVREQADRPTVRRRAESADVHAIEAVLDRLARAEIVVKHEGEFITIAAAFGTFIRVDQAAQAVVLSPVDGEAPMDFSVSTDDWDSVILLFGGHRADLSQLNTEDRSRVLTVKGGEGASRIMVIQGTQPAHFRVALRFLSPYMDLDRFLGAPSRGLDPGLQGRPGPQLWIDRLAHDPELRELLQDLLHNRAARPLPGPRLDDSAVPRRLPFGPLPGRELRLLCERIQTDEGADRFRLSCVFED